MTGPYDTPIDKPQHVDLTRLSVNMNAETAAALKSLGRDRGLTATEIIRRAVMAYKFLDDETRAGRKIVTVDRDEKEWTEVILL